MDNIQRIIKVIDDIKIPLNRIQGKANNFDEHDSNQYRNFCLSIKSDVDEIRKILTLQLSEEIWK